MRSIILFLNPRSDLEIYVRFTIKIYVVKISHSSNFNRVSIALWYENSVIIFFLSIVMDSDKRGTTSATIAIFSYCVLGNTANDTAGFSSAKHVIFGWLRSNFRYLVYSRRRIFLSMVVFEALKIP